MKKSTCLKITAIVLVLVAMFSTTGCAHMEKMVEDLKTMPEAMNETRDLTEVYEEQMELLEQFGSAGQTENEKQEENAQQEATEDRPENAETETDSEESKEAQYEELVENYVPNSNDIHVVMVGQEHKPIAAGVPEVVTDVYTSNPEVAQVSAQGKVTAVGEGVAYVVIARGKMCHVYLYAVYAPGASEEDFFSQQHPGAKYDHGTYVDSFVSTGENSQVLAVGSNHAPVARLLLNSSGSGVYTSNASVVSVTELGTVTAVGEGMAYVIYYSTTAVQVYLYFVIA